MKFSDYKEKMKKQMGWRWYWIEFKKLFDWQWQYERWLDKRFLHHMRKEEFYRKKIKKWHDL